ncbi:MAG: toll/interleukin-1 receptor domain-containing protein [Eudoraea sp.]|nr:toll/interleukin-1 receptor domain-containing protein [Eudoraea sp.]
MEKELAIKNPALKRIIKRINEGTCLVILGPNLLSEDGNSINDRLNNYLAEMLPKKVTHNITEGFLSFDDRTRQIDLEDHIEEFFEDELEPNKMYEKFAEIPFPLIINTAPDKTLNKVFDEKGKGYDYSFYNKVTPPKATIKKNITQIYNIFGDYEHLDSMILTYKDLFEYLESIMGAKKFKFKDQLHESKAVLFLGFSFDKWYFQLLLWIMKVDSKKLRSHLITQDNLKKFCEEEFNVEFFDDDASEIIDELYKAKMDGLIEEKENNYEPELFISYHWSDESEKMTEVLKKQLQEENLRILIDKDNLAYKADIKDFMRRIGKTDGAVVVISKGYLESINCMRELLELYKVYENEEFLVRIFPICLEDANFFDGKELLKYEQKWKDKLQIIEKEYRERGQSAGNVLDEDYKFIKEIIEKFTEITQKLAEINLSSSKVLKDTDFKALIADIKKIF